MQVDLRRVAVSEQWTLKAGCPLIKVVSKHRFICMSHMGRKFLILLIVEITIFGLPFLFEKVKLINSEL